MFKVLSYTFALFSALESRLIEHIRRRFVFVSSSKPHPVPAMIEE